MRQTVYFATNRTVTDAADAVNGYPATMVPPLNPAAITYGVAFIDGVDLNSGAQGQVLAITETQQGSFPASALDDLAHPGRNLLFFIHGFDNNFSDALTRAAFNAAWLAASAVAAADTTVIAFSWPSAGEIVDFPVLTGAYSGDQQMAKLSGPHLMSVLANLNPIITAARVSRPDIRVILLAHSMGNLALSSAVEHWFLAGNGDGLIFDDAILAAADCPYEAFAQPKLAQLSGLSRLAERISIYYSGADQVLQLSMAVNLGAQRLGQDGPLHRTDPAAFPPATFSMVDCSAIRDYQYGFLSSHQYYRLSPAVRSIIAASIGGAAT